MAFNKGDLVRIYKKVSHQKGWNNSWNKEMDKFVDVDTIRVVKSVSSMGVTIEGIYQENSTYQYQFPSGSLVLDSEYSTTPYEREVSSLPKTITFNSLADPVFLIDPLKLSLDDLISFIARTEFEVEKLKGVL
jgi:hypothetical protein